MFSKNRLSKKLCVLFAVCMVMTCLSFNVFADTSSKDVTVTDTSTYYVGTDVSMANQILSQLVKSLPQTKQYDDGTYKGTLTLKNYYTTQEQFPSAPINVYQWKIFYVFAGTVVAYTTPPPVPPADPNNLGEKITTGKTIQMNNYLLSQDGRYKAVYQGDGNFVVYRVSDMKALWSTGTHGKGASSFEFRADGNLVISKYTPAMRVYTVVGYDWIRTWINGVVSYEMVPIYGWKDVPGGYSDLWQSKTAGNPGATLLMQNDSNLVIYNASGRPVWACGIRD